MEEQWGHQDLINMKWIDDFLNNITMYRLLLYFLIVLLVFGAVFGFLGLLPFSGISIIASSVFIVIVCWISNTLFAKIFKAQTNLESVYITALILTLIFSPAKDLSGLILLFWVSVIAMAGKYILAINKKQIFNPAALSAVIISFTFNGAASWWVGTGIMLPIVVVGGILLVRKIKRADLVVSFLVAAIAVITISGLTRELNPLTTIQKVIFETPILFFAFVMLTEPLTTPPTQPLQLIYGAIVGFIFSPELHIAGIFSTPELALVVGNIFSYIVSPKERLLLSLKKKIKLTPDTYQFTFNLDKNFKFKAGQYLEWTLGQKYPDARGTRRYFTIASSPTEKDIILRIKFYENSSSYKREMLKMETGNTITAGNLAGDFTMPSDLNKKLVFIAGGIGVTPYRSMIKYLIDANEKRDVIFIYSEKNVNEMVYKDIFDEAKEKLGIKVVYFETDKNGHMTSELFKKEVEDYKERTFYISGSHGMVTAFEETLKEMDMPTSQIKIDYFPGYA